MTTIDSLFTSTPVFLSAAVVATLACVGVLRLFLRKGEPMPKPPGPKGLPLVGNVVESMELQPATFSKWRAQWGDVVSITVLGQTIVVLNTWKAASDLLEKRSTIYSDRPNPVFCTELIGWKDVVLFAPYGDRLREQRRLVHNLVGTRAIVDQVLPPAQLESHWRKFLCQVSKRPEDLTSHVHNTVLAVLLQLSHGSLEDLNKDFITKNTKDAMDQFPIVTAPGASVVDIIPPLRYLPKWFPGASFHREADAYAKVLNDMVNVPFDIVKRQLREGTAKQSFTSNLLQEATLSDDQEHLIKWTAASIYFGGTNTSVPTILAFFLAMALHPEVQLRAQEEIDSVTNGTRFPGLDDRAQKQLPYVEAVIKEVFRWNPAVPLEPNLNLIIIATTGLRRTSKDDVYENHFIPEGSIVIPNIYGFLHDPSGYEDPMLFKPERFMPSEKGEGERDPRPPCFGFGRRACPGAVLGETDVYLAVASTLSVFTITAKSPLRDGKAPPSAADYFTAGGTVSWPKPFECTIKPRSARAEALISSFADTL